MLYKRAQLLAFVLGFLTSIVYFRFFNYESEPSWVSKLSTKVLASSANLSSKSLLPFLSSQPSVSDYESVEDKINVTQIAAAVEQYKWRSGLESVFLLVMVKSAPANSIRRDSVRESWFILNGETKRAVPNRLTRQYFVVGEAKEPSVEEKLTAEKKAHGDLLRAPLPDGYTYLTVKAMWSLSFALGHHDFKFLLMADDDTFVNWLTFLPWLARTPQRGVYTGRLHANAHVERDPKSKWYVPRRIYSPDSYPPFALGIGYVMSFDVVLKAVEIARQRPLLGIDDAMVGWLVREAGIVARHEEKIKVKWDCHDPSPYIIGGLEPNEMKAIGARARQRQHLC